MGFPCGYGLAVMSYTQMMLLCAIGDAVQTRVFPLNNFFCLLLSESK